jgi:hypothetical protein
MPDSSTTGTTQPDGNAGDATFMTNADVSFASLKATPRRKTVAPPVTPGTTSTVQQSRLPGVRRGGGPAGRGGRGDGGGRGARGTGLIPRGRGRGAK